VEVLGDERVEGLLLRDTRTGASETLAVDGLTLRVRRVPSAR